MERLARKLAHNVSMSQGFNEEKEAVVAYGLIAIIQISVTVLIIAVLGILIRVPIEALIVCFSASILRKSSGGAHAGTAELCTCFSAVYCLSTAYISKMLLTHIYSPVPMAAAMLVLFGSSFFIVYKNAPVDSPNKPIRTEEKKKKMRKGSFLTLAVYLLISVTLFVLGLKYDIYRSYAIALLFGLSWQAFTLTHLGALFIGLMDKLFLSKKEVQK